jgi:YHS domain-containing protein
VIRRLVVLVLAVLLAYWWSRKLRAAFRQSAGQVPGGGRAPGRPGEPVRDLGPLVRDRVCNTFLPRSRALTEVVDSEEHFFCSEKCREEFRSKQPVRSA